MEINPKEVKTLLDQKAPIVLVDVREEQEVELCKIEGSVHLAMSQFADWVGQLDKSKAVITYCHHGMRSLNVAKALLQNGFNDVRSMSGGIERWALEIDPQVPRY